jgi:hypothetical protein
MSDDYSRVLNIIGLSFNLVGVLILFRWGMPFRVPMRGAVPIILEGIDEKAVALDHTYVICGYIGLVLLILGTVLQIIATLMSS